MHATDVARACPPRCDAREARYFSLLPPEADRAAARCRGARPGTTEEVEWQHSRASRGQCWNRARDRFGSCRTRPCSPAADPSPCMEARQGGSRKIRRGGRRRQGNRALSRVRDPELARARCLAAAIGVGVGRRVDGESGRLGPGADSRCPLRDVRRYPSLGIWLCPSRARVGAQPWRDARTRGDSGDWGDRPRRSH